MSSDTLEDDQSLEQLGEELEESKLMTDGGRDIPDDDPLSDFKDQLEETKENIYNNASERVSDAKDRLNRPASYTAASAASAAGAYSIRDEVIEASNQLPELISQTAAYSANLAAGTALGALALGTGAKAVHGYLEERDQE